MPRLYGYSPSEIPYWCEVNPNGEGIRVAYRPHAIACASVIAIMLHLDLIKMSENSSVCL